MPRKPRSVPPLKGRRRPTPRDVAPFFRLWAAAWIPCVVSWDTETGELHYVEGPRGFASYREAVEASRFLTVDTDLYS
jgi:hypothetical protein